VTLPWLRLFDEKLAAMTPEAREQFRAEWKQRFDNRCDWLERGREDGSK